MVWYINNLICFKSVYKEVKNVVQFHLLRSGGKAHKLLHLKNIGNYQTKYGQR